MPITTERVTVTLPAELERVAPEDLEAIDAGLALFLGLVNEA